MYLTGDQVQGAFHLTDIEATCHMLVRPGGTDHSISAILLRFVRQSSTAPLINDK